MRKTYVLDTSVLLYNADSIRSFGGKEVVIPCVVLEELDRFKTREGEVGRNARQVARDLNKLRQEGDLRNGVEVTLKGGRLRVELNFTEPLESTLHLEKADDRILNVCLGLKKETGNEVILVTKDINLAVRADVYGVNAQDFIADKQIGSISDLYTGTLELVVPGELVDDFHAGAKVHVEDLAEDTSFIYPNHYITLISDMSPAHTALVRVGKRNQLEKLRAAPQVWGLSAKNREQHYALDAIFNKDIPLVTLCGPAGTGKSLVSIAAALELVQDRGEYDRLIVSRPVQPMGRDIGFIPGTIEEKMDPWMGPIKDCINFLTSRPPQGQSMYEEMVYMGKLEIEPLTYIRGRSLPNTLFIIDEAQDLTHAEIKTIISRMGENSKLILIGDVLQISNPYLNPTNSGLASAVERFKEYDVAAHVTLTKGERSTLATIASNIL